MIFKSIIKHLKNSVRATTDNTRPQGQTWYRESKYPNMSAYEVYLYQSNRPCPVLKTSSNENLITNNFISN